MRGKQKRVICVTFNRFIFLLKTPVPFGMFIIFQSKRTATFFIFSPVTSKSVYLKKNLNVKSDEIVMTFYHDPAIKSVPEK